MHKDFQLLKKYATSDKTFQIVVNHSLEVLKKSIAIIQSKQLYNLDLDLIISGCLLHDIGTFTFLENNNTPNYIQHGIIGGKILRKEERVKEALIAERHIGSGLSKQDILTQQLPLPVHDFISVSLEEKLICYADMFSSKNGKLHTLQEIEIEFQKYTPEAYQRFLDLKCLFETTNL